MPWTTLCDFEDLDDGQGKYVEIDGYRVVVFRVGADVHVTDNTCPHAGAGLYAGWIDAGCVVCPLHHWAFDLRTGALRGSGSETEMLRIYPSRILTDGPRSLVQAELPMP